ncbi:DUF6298 domain-containing protein [Neotamlana nanhaiensis]|uniref:DUF6298 domain-containing protein n=1 Tax=Neotamlana nanhaiensis TaxID=1382798 RepID=UPI0005CC5FDD|nr:DUF6298 domain-containing protein [Tamlana nanhaiensis]
MHLVNVTYQFKQFVKTITLLSCVFCCAIISAQSQFPDIKKNKNGKIERIPDSLGNTIPDFSYAGYKVSEKPIPTIEAKVFVPNQTEDATEIIQKAIDYIVQLKPDDHGFRGAVLLDKGVFNVEGTLYLKNSGVVLRGSGSNETQILGTGIKREAIIRVVGEDNIVNKDTLQLANNFVPLSAETLQLKTASTLQVGDNIIIRKPLTNTWLKALNTEYFGGESGWIGWKTRDWDIQSFRTVTKIEGNTITLNAPLTITSNDYSQIEVIKYNWSGRIENIGIENLSIQSTYDVSNPKDEQHRWYGITMENVKNAWVRQVNFKHLAGSAVALLKTAQQITVEDCISEQPISEIAAHRRQTFYTEGQQTLFQRCYSEFGYNDFAVGGYGTAGPNAFVQCESYLSNSNSGSMGSWATGVLFDVAYIDANAILFDNQEQAKRGAGWTAANSVIWESSASKIACYSPPTAQNWAFGVWGGIMTGNGHWKDVNNHIMPRSLFYAQLENRLGSLPFESYVYDTGSEPTSSPTIDQAQQLTLEAVAPKKTLKDWIKKVSEENIISSESKKVKSVHDIKVKYTSKSAVNTSKVSIKNGWLTHNGAVITGKKSNVMWWRGSLRNHDVNKASAHVTRFVPGKIGKGFTDDLTEVVNKFKSTNVAALDNNYGLWYERRMDDHERVRRIDADVWAPFYEQPFNRSGKGQAWDGLSKYDLNQPNKWYWNRLKQFASLAEAEGQILINQQYFQHNILEAGAHWSSSPWRSANNINETDFPEPVPYAGDKRIFMAEQFYDVTHEHRKKLHQQFIKQSLENFKENSNVIHFTSAEYTGPLHFMQFWLDEVKKYKQEAVSGGFIGLSATKDVQDAILNDSDRTDVVDVIDIRYWHYREDETTYAPEGGKNLAPRQHARKMKTGKETEEQIYRAVREYRKKYPEKAVLYSTNAAPRFGWAVLMAGGSLPALPKIENVGFNIALSNMKPAMESNYESAIWKLKNEGVNYLSYLRNAKEVSVDLSKYKGKFQAFWINQKDGSIASVLTLKGGIKHTINASSNNAKVLFIQKKN